MNRSDSTPSRLSVTLGVVILAGCQSIAPSALDPPSSYEAGDLLVRVELDASTVRRGGQFTVRPSIENRGEEATTHTGVGACPWRIQVLRNSKDVTGWFTDPFAVCLTIQESYAVPGGSVRAFPIAFTAAALPGEYQVIVRWQLSPELEQVATRLIVR